MRFYNKIGKNTNLLLEIFSWIISPKKPECFQIRLCNERNRNGYSYHVSGKIINKINSIINSIPKEKLPRKVISIVLRNFIMNEEVTPRPMIHQNDSFPPFDGFARIRKFCEACLQEITSPRSPVSLSKASISLPDTISNSCRPKHVEDEKHVC